MVDVKLDIKSDIQVGAPDGKGNIRMFVDGQPKFQSVDETVKMLKLPENADKIIEMPGHKLMTAGDAAIKMDLAADRKTGIEALARRVLKIVEPDLASANPAKFNEIIAEAKAHLKGKPLNAERLAHQLLRDINGKDIMMGMIDDTKKRSIGEMEDVKVLARDELHHAVTQEKSYAQDIKIKIAGPQPDGKL